MKIRVYGCEKYKSEDLFTRIVDILDHEGLKADIENVVEAQQIAKEGITSTPALIIDDKKLCEGRLPSALEIRSWLFLDDESAKQNLTV